MRFIRISMAALCAAWLIAPASAYDGSANGEWMTVGFPRQVHQGMRGDFYLTGSAMGRCANVTPDYVRMNMSEANWKEMYALILYAASQKLSLDCVVDSGCGSSQVWVTYCRTLLQQ